MARPQSGIIPTPFQYNRVQVFELYDLPMTSMTVGQFSVMIPGLGHQLAQAHPGEQLRVTVGFGFMFWTLAWHGLSPRQLQPFETLESGDREITEGEGDLWVSYTSTDRNLINKLVNKVNNNLGTLVRVVEDRELLWDTPPERDPVFPESIWIPGEEAEFERGTFLLQMEVEHPLLYTKSLLPSLNSMLKQQELTDQVLIRRMELNEGAKKGSHLQVFHQNSGKLDTLLEDWMDEDQQNLMWGDDGVRSARATRIFIPSLDVLTGLRQGGIRMNRFSQTRQWKD